MGEKAGELENVSGVDAGDALRQQPLNRGCIDLKSITYVEGFACVGVRFQENKLFMGHPISERSWAMVR